MYLEESLAKCQITVILKYPEHPYPHHTNLHIVTLSHRHTNHKQTNTDTQITKTQSDTNLSCVVTLVTLVWTNQLNYFENAT